MNYDASGIRKVRKGRFVICGDRLGVVVKMCKGTAWVRWQGDVGLVNVRSNQLTVQRCQ